MNTKNIQLKTVFTFVAMWLFCAIFIACNNENQVKEVASPIANQGIVGKWVLEKTMIGTETQVNSSDKKDYANFGNDGSIELVQYGSSGETSVVKYRYTLLNDEFTLEYKSEYAGYVFKQIYELESLNAESFVIRLNKKIENGVANNLNPSDAPVLYFKRSL